MSIVLNPLSLTRKLLAFNTINPPGQERDCARYLGEVLEAGGFQTSYYEHAEGRGTLVARLEGRGHKAPICFTGHIDTVPLGAVEWSKDPFNGEQDGNKVFGRGTSDMKSGVAAMVLASLELAKQPQRGAGIILVLTAGEETGFEGAAYLAEVNALGKAGAIVVGEPTANYPLVGHKGMMWLEVSTKGITAHGSMPEEGDNAIYKAARAVTKLENFRFEEAPHPILGKPTLNLGTIKGGLNANSVPDRTMMQIDVRTIPGQDHGVLQEKIHSLLGEEVEINRVHNALCLATDPNDEWVQEVFSIMTPFLKGKPELRSATYSTDAAILTPAYENPPTIILGPGEPTMAHKTDEYCDITKLQESIDIYLEIARQWCHL